MKSSKAGEESKEEEKEREEIQQAKDTVEQAKEGRETIFEAATSKALRPFVIISSSYLLFTITDGALRMIVLLHAYTKNFSALQVAIMFTLYELAGVFTNLAAGFMGAKWGIKVTLISGLALQLFSYGYVHIMYKCYLLMLLYLRSKVQASIHRSLLITCTHPSFCHTVCCMDGRMIGARQQPSFT